MNLPQVFQFDNHAVRTIEKDDDVWFVANDITGLLGYKDSADAIKKHCKSPELLKSGDSPHPVPSPYGMTIIPERDVYRLIMRSKLPAAEKFEEWIVSEVLPAIRRNGRYVQATPDYVDEFSSSPMDAFRAIMHVLEKHEVDIKQNGRDISGLRRLMRAEEWQIRKLQDKCRQLAISATSSPAKQKKVINKLYKIIKQERNVTRLSDIPCCEFQHSFRFVSFIKPEEVKSLLKAA